MFTLVYLQRMKIGNDDWKRQRTHLAQMFVFEIKTTLFYFTSNTDDDDSFFPMKYFLNNASQTSSLCCCKLFFLSPENYSIKAEAKHQCMSSHVSI